MGDKKLSDNARAIFDAAKQNETLLVIPAIVIAEMYFANKRQQLFDDFVATYLDLEQQVYIQIVPFHANEVLDFDLNAAVPEMHDRMIVGVARRLNAPLITIDLRIRNANLVRIIW